MKPMNYESIRRKTLVFWSFLVVLVFATFIPVYFFFKSYQLQQQRIAGDITAYKNTLNKQLTLHTQIDSLYGLMQLLNVNAVRNDLFLEKYIADEKNQVIKLMGEDSTAFGHYSFLLSRVDKMLLLKDSIRGIGEREQLALKDLNDCINNTLKVQRDLSYDPSRNFSTAK